MWFPLNGKVEVHRQVSVIGTVSSYTWQEMPSSPTPTVPASQSDLLQLSLVNAFPGLRVCACVCVCVYACVWIGALGLSLRVRRFLLMLQFLICVIFKSLHLLSKLLQSNPAGLEVDFQRLQHVFENSGHQMHWV